MSDWILKVNRAPVFPFLLCVFVFFCVCVGSEHVCEFASLPEVGCHILSDTAYMFVLA